MPLIGIYDGGYLELSIQIAIYAALALGLNIVVGFAGLLDLGYIAFFAVGAYIWAMFSADQRANGVRRRRPDRSGVGVLRLYPDRRSSSRACVGILLGLPVLRLRGDYLAIVTLGFGEMIRVLARNLDQPDQPDQRSAGAVRRRCDRRCPASPSTSPGRLPTSLGITLPNVEPVAQQLLVLLHRHCRFWAIIILVARRLRRFADWSRVDGHPRR